MNISFLSNVVQHIDTGLEYDKRVQTSFLQLQILPKRIILPFNNIKQLPLNKKNL